MKARIDAVVEAVIGWGEVMPYFPASDTARRMIVAEVYNFIGTAEQLEWFAVAVPRHIRKWDGLPLLRALYCTRFAPDDGAQPVCDVPGYTTEELEAKYRDHEIAENTRRLEEYKLEANGKALPFPLPKVKRLA